jgi:hypothetical protein
MKADFDRNKSIQELEQDNWGEPTFHSHLVKACHDLRRKPLIQFAIEDLRLMIGQGIGLAYLVPMTLDHLEKEPLAEGDFYPGDLLTAVLEIDETFWIGDQDSLHRVLRIISQIREALSSLDEPNSQTVQRVLQKATPLLGKIKATLP